MNGATKSLLAIMASAFLHVVTVAEQPTIAQAFTGDGGTTFTLFHRGLAGPPQAGRGAVLLTNASRHGETSSGIYFHEAIADAPSSVQAEFTFSTRRGAHGFSFFLAPEGTDFAALSGAATPVRWESPNAPGLFAVGFNLHNPPTANWFDAQGNYYARPEREVSLHWDGREIARVFSPVGFDDGAPHRARLNLRSIPGAMTATVTIDDTVLLDGVPVEGMAPGRVVAGLAARTGLQTTEVAVFNLDVSFGGKQDSKAQQEPLVQELFRDLLVHGERREPSVQVDFPPDPGRYERVVLRIELRCPGGGCDPWDKVASIRVLDTESGTVELARFITPFGVVAQWDLDVTQLQHLLRGRRTVELFVDTWMSEEKNPELQKGWLVSATISRHGKVAKENNASVVPLWTGAAKLGSPADPYPDFFLPREIAVPPATRRARIFFTATGHGQFGEFTPFTRTIRANGEDFTNRLWVEDCYLNPTRPQRGTWKFDRAGWCPGSVVPPWTIDISHLATPGGVIHVEHISHPYEARHLPDEGDWSNLMIESYIVFEGE